MHSEQRIIKASILAGVTDIIVGLFMFITGWHQWYYDHFHVFGILGIGMLAYGIWHGVLYSRDTGRSIWQRKK